MKVEGRALRVMREKPSNKGLIHSWKVIVIFLNCQA
jgi:hypothetical protein